MNNVKSILINQSVAILCDGNNIERSIHEESKTTNAMVNFDTLIPKLLSGRGLNRLIYFREGRSISHKLAERLHNKYYGSVIPCHKTADIPLSIKATQLASKVDTIIIMSGDSDFLDLVTHLKSEGVRVEIAAVRKTTARLMFEAADYFHPITRDDWFVYTSKPRGFRPKPKEAVVTPAAAKPAEKIPTQEIVVKVEAKPMVKKPAKSKAPVKKPAKKTIKKVKKK
tara:strand:- start:13997 stop:14674 length:678 start_codon:yes stop_codon:yes gene_type:complete